ncbi:MAG: hypothetical protein IPL72_12055 [Sulfuritalea sp.]|nr:hypothetical protein [Sulfuritalea sp.]
MKFGQCGFISFGAMTLIIGGMALAGLLVYGWITGQELPIGPAIAVALVNIIAAVKLALDSRKVRQAPPPAPEAAARAASRASGSKARGSK